MREESRMFRFVLIVICLLAVVQVMAASETSEADKDAESVLTLVNKARSEAGLRPLKLNATLTRLCKTKANDMAARGYFSHYSRKLGTPFNLMDKAGVRYTTGAENIAMGQESVSEVFSAWMKSRGHRHNILNPNFEEMGLARDASGKNYWAQLFIGNPAGTVKARTGVVSSLSSKLRGLMN